MSKSLAIRKLMLADMEKVTLWFNRLVDEQPGIVENTKVEPLTANSFIKNQVALMEEGRLLCLVATCGTKIVAKVDVKPLERTVDRHIAELSFGVLREHRDAGIALLKEAVRQARDRGLKGLLYYVMSCNTLFQEIFEAVGFVKCGVIPRFYRVDDTYWDRVILYYWIDRS